MNASDRHHRKQEVQRILPMVTALLRTRPFWNGEAADELIRGAEYDRGKLRIEYLANAVVIDGRPRIIAPQSLDIRFDGMKVLMLRWDELGERQIRSFVPGEWIDCLEKIASAASRPPAQVPR